MIRTVGWIALALAPLWFSLAVQPARQRALQQELSRTQEILEHGFRWRFGQPASLVGGQPVGVENWRFSQSALKLEQVSNHGYVPLNFQGLRLPTAGLHRLRIDLSASGESGLLLYHRSRLDGPAAGSQVIPLKAGHQLLEFDARELAWTVNGEAASWGQEDNALATLRLHPASGHASALASVSLHELALLPGKPQVPEARLPTEAMAERWPWQRGIWSMASFRATLREFRQQPELWSLEGSATSTSPGAPLHRLLDSLLSVALPLLLLMLLIRPGARAASGITLLTLCLWWGLSQTSWQPLSTAACVGALLLCLILRFTLSGSAAATRDLVKRPAGSSGRDLLLLLLALGLLLALLLLLDNQLQPLRLSPARWLTYIAWAGLQQWLLCAMLYPLARMAGASVATAIAVAAGVFGFSHMPNLELMIMTWLLALGCVWHYSRHQRLMAPVALHGVAGSVLLAVTPTPMLYSASTGPGFWF